MDLMFSHVAIRQALESSGESFAPLADLRIDANHVDRALVHSSCLRRQENHEP